MEVSRPFELSRIEEIKILQNVRLINIHDLNHVYSKENLRVQFQISGELKGTITCYLCLDGFELSYSEKNFIFPLFVEAMNILIGRQISLDEELGDFDISMSSPKLTMNSSELNTGYKRGMQKYELELESATFSVLTEYSLTAIN
jgi:hypothetical protein